jgi:hypothetical protein
MTTSALPHHTAIANDRLLADFYEAVGRGISPPPSSCSATTSNGVFTARVRLVARHHPDPPRRYQRYSLSR